MEKHRIKVDNTLEEAEKLIGYYGEVEFDSIKEAQKIILEYVNDYFDDEIVAQVKKALEECIVNFDEEKKIDFGLYQDEVKDKKLVGGFAKEEYDGKKSINLPYEDMSCLVEQDGKCRDYDAVIGIIVHEYAHILRKINSKYGEMFEEGFADVFSHTCIIHSKIKKMIAENKEVSQLFVGRKSSYKYGKAESQVKAILYILNDHDLDMKLIGEYIFGNENVFVDKCSQILGEEFKDYFKVANSTEDQYFSYHKHDQNSEVMLVNIISNYIKNNGLDISRPWNNSYYFQYGTPLSSTLAKGVASSGIEVFPENQKNYYQYCLSIAQDSEKLEQDTINQRFSRINKITNERYDISGKNGKEIYSIIQNLCSDYIQKKNSDLQEYKILVEEIQKMVPNFDNFYANFMELRNVARELGKYDQLESLFENIEPENVNYESVSNIISSTLDKYKKEQLVSNIKTMFDKCDSKEKLFSTIAELNSHQNETYLEEILPNYGDFIKFVIELKDQIPDEFSPDMDYKSLYEIMLNNYITKKEDELSQVKEQLEIYSQTSENITKKYVVLHNKEVFSEIDTKNSNLNSNLQSEQTKLDVETKNRNKNQMDKDSLIKEKSELHKKNDFIKLFSKRKIEKLKENIEDIGKKIQVNDLNIESIKTSISDIRSQIKINEQQLIDLCGLDISSYSSKLKECKQEGVTENQLLDNLHSIQEKIELLNIPQKEKELKELYDKNEITRQSEKDIQEPQK